MDNESIRISMKEIKELIDVFERINSCAEKLSSFDVWDKETAKKIVMAEMYLRKAMTEIIEVTGVDETQNLKP